MRDFKSFQAQLQKRKAQLVKVRTIFSFFFTSKANPACREKQHLEEVCDHSSSLRKDLTRSVNKKAGKAAKA